MLESPEAALKVMFPKVGYIDNVKNARSTNF
jgi:phage antirepressor YoqD-like protein